jgi:hypothetical protein
MFYSLFSSVGSMNAYFISVVAKQYYFYLAFENSDCQDYITEKFWSSLMAGKASSLNNINLQLLILLTLLTIRSSTKTLLGADSLLPLSHSLFFTSDEIPQPFVYD